MEQDQPSFTSVRLTRKYAEKIDGVDLSRNQVGDLLDLPHRDARMLIAEGWAAPCERGSTGTGSEEPKLGNSLPDVALAGQTAEPQRTE